MYTIPLECQPDSVELLPNSYTSLIATYRYKEGVRSGSLLTINLKEYIPSQSNFTHSSKLNLECGILHAKPFIFDHMNYAICAASDGNVKIAKIDPTITIKESIIVDSNALVLSVYRDLNAGNIVTGLSNGKIAYIINDKVINTWIGHEMEVWTCHLDNNVVYTGSDDSVLRIWDMNTFCGDFTKKSNKCIGEIKSFGAGVTWVSTNGNEIITGSHDNFIRYFDKRELKNEVEKLKLPGSPWKLVFDNSICYVAACQGLISAFSMQDKMYDKILEINDKFKVGFEKLPKMQHDPLIYSLDVRDSLLVATDFYNKRLIIEPVV